VFTGIIRERGRVADVQQGANAIRLSLEAPETASRAAIGDSVAVNGVCLTAVAVADGTLAFDAVPETIRRSSLGRLQAGDEVNVEPALRVGEPLGGHYVQGHVDGVGHVRSVATDGDDDVVVWVGAGPELVRYLVEKGSVTVEGVALTVTAVDEDGFSVALVPHTLAATTLGALSAGDPVNLEVDVLAKYVERLLPGLRSSS
jgi:riboflavin synthase